MRECSLPCISESSSCLLSEIANTEIYGSIVLPAVLLVYGCETWSLTLREELRLRVFENRVLRRLCEPERDVVTGGRRRLLNEEL
jgi:hypothetical protein